MLASRQAVRGAEAAQRQSAERATAMPTIITVTTTGRTTVRTKVKWKVCDADAQWSATIKSVSLGLSERDDWRKPLLTLGDVETRHAVAAVRRWHRCTRPALPQP